MSAAARRLVDYLGDPYLVRRIQERFGVQQIHSSADPPPHTTGTVHSGGNGVVLNPTDGYKWLASKTRRRLKHVRSDSSTSSTNSLSPEPEIIVETYPVLNIFFRLASELGHEAFYITFFPFLFWNADTNLGRHIVLLWCSSMYVGQACKALFKWKRPACPPAIRIDTNPRLNTEYGLPSTHATVATTVPFYIAYFLNHRYYVCFPTCFPTLNSRYSLLQLSLWIGLPVATVWCVSVCLSRIYLGVHSVLVRS